MVTLTNILSIPDRQRVPAAVVPGAGGPPRPPVPAHVPGSGLALLRAVGLAGALRPRHAPLERTLHAHQRGARHGTAVHAEAGTVRSGAGAG